MGKFSVSPEKEAQLFIRMKELGIAEEELTEKFIRGGGPGGQKINTSSSCVYLSHEPSGIEVKCQQERSQALNRYIARSELCDKLEAQILGKESKEEQARERVRRQKRRRSRRSKQKMVEEKRQKGEQKELRKPVSPDDKDSL